MRIVALVCVRNELSHLEFLLPYLERENIEVVLVDNDSDDGTLDAISDSKYPNVIDVARLPWNGSFDLTAQLRIKHRIFNELKSDWLIHQDADEILQSREGWGGLRSSIVAADIDGFNVVNFNELVMLPKDLNLEDCYSNSSHYYYFEPRPLRLMRAWKCGFNLTNYHTGGHILSGDDVCVSPKHLLLKHFIVKSQAHAYSKYLNRMFSQEDQGKGWHGNRLAFNKENLKIPTEHKFLHKLDNVQQTPAVLPKAIHSHYWEWE
jgi:glycosyltransferase involved in cell wall biosynthesis